MLARTTTAIEMLTSQIRQLEATVEALGANRRGNLQLPFTERAQALKMVREGRSARQIASTLGVPQGEILLLTRVAEVQNGLALLPAGSRRIASGLGETA